MVPAGNKAKRLSSVSHTTKTLHHHHHHHHHHETNRAKTFQNKFSKYFLNIYEFLIKFRNFPMTVACYTHQTPKNKTDKEPCFQTIYPVTHFFSRLFPQVETFDEMQH